MNTELFHLIALSLIPKLGPSGCKKILSAFGSASSFFEAPPSQLLAQGLQANWLRKIDRNLALIAAEKEAKFIEQRQISIIALSDESYPERLKHCNDSPILLYGKGTLPLNQPKTLSIVGTRNATAYGKQQCKALIEGLSHLNILIVSGLAYGIDACAHEAALDMKLPTIAVMAHGFNRIYPYEHRHIADRMLENGGLLSDFHSNAPFHPGNFPARNRIVAGLTDATLVIESAEKGGSLITADLANGYHREVFALPGRTTDTQSKGCNLLIKTNRAALVESAAELIAEMGWESKKNKKNIQHALWPQLSEEEQHLLKLMNKETGTHSDELINNSGINGGKLSALLLGLELKGLIYAIPGNRYRLN